MTPNLLDTGPSPFGWHRYETFMRCPQLYAYSHKGPPRDDAESGRALALGSMVHVGLAHHYARMREEQHGRAPGSLYEPLDAITALAAKKNGPAWHEHAGLARDIVRGYLARYAAERPEILHVEEVFALDFDGAPITMRVDLVWRGKDGRVYFVDHKCLPGDARVWTTTGDVPMRTLVDTDADVAAWTEDQFLTATPALRAVPAGIQRVHRLTFAHGATGRFGYRHPLLTPEGWVQAEDLRPGDLVAVPLRYPERREADASDAFLRVLGQLLSDGVLNIHSLRWTKKDADKRARFIEDVRLLGADPVEKFDPTGRRTPWVDTRGPVLRGLLGKWGVARVKSPERSIPEALLATLSRRQIGQLVGGLWAGDGHAGIGGNKRARICFSGRSEQLCRDVQRLLLALGVPATLTRSSVAYKGERRPVWTTTVVGDGKARFLALVEEGVIPVPHLDTSHLWPALNTTTAMKGLGRIEGDVWWVPVAETHLDGEEECFDLEVPEHHTFVAEGVITHNTTGRITTSHPRWYAMSGQFLAYRWAGRLAFGEQFGGVICNLLQTDAKDITFARPTLAPVPGQLRKFPAAVREAWRRLQEIEAQNLPVTEWPAHPSEHTCWTRYGPCPAYAQCEWATPPE